jgi:hypothetical protein
MLKAFRATLVWLMMLAIPTQGIAAASMVYCGGGHQAMLTGSEATAKAGLADAAALQRAEPRGQSAHSDHGVHDHGASVTHLEEPGTAADQASAAGALEQSPAKCSVCALGCNAAAIVSGPLVLPPQGVSSALVIVVFEVPASFFTDGPKRPPRSFLA